MKRFLHLLALLVLLPIAARAQVGIGTTLPDARAALEIKASDKGLLIPRLTASQRTAITSPPQGLMVYQTDGTAGGGPQTGFWYYVGTGGWVFLDAGGATAENGLSQSSTGIGLGGMLNHVTVIDQSGFDLGLTGGRVGINNDTPGYELDVTGTTRTTDLIVGRVLTGNGAEIGPNLGLGIRADGGLNLGENTAGNLFIGYRAGQATAPNSNTGLGINNLFIGNSAGYSNTTGHENYFSGYYAGYSNTTGLNNHFRGSSSGYSNTTGNNNIFDGVLSGYSNTTGGSNLFSGVQSGQFNQTGSGNVFSGTFSGYRNTTGNNNLFLGYQSGQYNLTGSNNIALGYNSGPANGSGALSNAIALGSNVSLAQSNTVVLGSGADVGIGTNTPGQKVEVVGNVKITGAGNGLIFPDGTKQTTAATSGSSFALPFSGTYGGAAGTPAFDVSHTNGGIAVRGSAPNTGVGVSGSSSTGSGVYGTASGSGGYGVRGAATANNTAGVYGTAVGTNTYGVIGDGQIGVQGQGGTGPGLSGISTSGPGLQTTKSGSQTGRLAELTNANTSNDSTGVYVSTVGARPALRAVSTAASAQAAIRGVKQAGTDGIGVEGVVTSGGGNAAGVLGNDKSGTGGGSGVLGLTAGGYGVRGIASASGGYGVSGTATDSYGVIGSSQTGSGVYGSTGANSSALAGVLGVGNAGGSSVGVLGTTTSGYGVRGVASANGGYGVTGIATNAYGVLGTSTSGTGTFGLSTSGPGVQGSSTSSYGAQGTSSSSSGVFGQTSASGAGLAGVEGNSTASSGTGVLGTTTSGYGVRGEATGTSGYGVIGVASNTNGIGVIGSATGAASGITGQASGTGRAGYFNQNGSSSTANAVEVQNSSLGRTAYFNHSNTSNAANAVEINSVGSGAALKITHPVAFNNGATQGILVTDPSTNNLVQVRSDNINISTTSLSEYTQFFAGHGSMNTAGPQALVAFGGSVDANFGVIQTLAAPGGIAARFEGKVQVIGTLSKSGGSFQIDHPLDPANQYLYHSFVESPDMMNVYNGNITLDARGEATVQLPAWFEALNRDFRYQLTPIGAAFTPYVKEKVVDNKFRIAGQPGAEVSWQITGIRHDKWADANRIPVEQPKEASNQGMYLHPALFGQPAERGIGHVEAPEGTSRAKYPAAGPAQPAVAHP